MTDSLLSRLQILTEPSREIDAQIALANGWRQLKRNLWFKPADANNYSQSFEEPPHYTGSLDAVEPLAAEFYYLFAKGKTRPDEPLYGVHLYRADGRQRQSFRSHAILAKAEHDLPSVALLIAIMKAKEESKP